MGILSPVPLVKLMDRGGLTLKKALYWVDENLEKVICMTLLTAFTIILFIQVIMRYVFNSSLPWSEELSRYMFIWMVYLGVSYGAKQMKHLKIEAFLSVFPKKWRPYVLILAEILTLVFAIYVIFSASFMVQRIGRLGTKSTALQIPMQYVHAAPLVGFTLTAIRQVQNIFHQVKNLRKGGEAA